MGWGPVDWVGRVLPEQKFENKCTSFFEFFGFERPLLRYVGSVFSVTERTDEDRMAYSRKWMSYNEGNKWDRLK